MNKSKYISLLLFALPLLGFSQADVTVEEETTIIKTLSIGDSFISNTEFNVSDTNGDGLVEIQINSEIGDSFMETSGSDFRIGSSDRDLTFRAGNTTFSRLKTTGEFAIGTGTPDAKLHVSQGGNSGINNPVILLESVVSKKPLLQFSEGGSATTSGMSWYLDGSPTQNRLHVNSSLSDELVTFSNLGRFGIGVIGDPRETLEVNGNILLPNCNDFIFMEGATTKARLNCNGSSLLLENLETDGDIELISEQNDVILRSDVNDVVVDSGDDIVFRINGDNKVFLRPSGRLGINDSSLNSMVDIKQQTDDDGVKVQDNQNTDEWSFDIGLNDLFLKFNGNDVGFFNDDDGEYTALSDRRLKKDIQPLEGGVMDKLMQVQASRYNYINDDNKVETIGFMAQDLMKLFPEVVSSRKNENGETYYAVSYNLLNVLVVKAIQEQQSRKEMLLSQWNDLQNLDAELEEVKEQLSALSTELNKQEFNK